MIDTTDPIERLRAVNPVPLAEVGLIQPDAVLFHRITTGATVAGAGAPLRRRRRRRLVPVIVAASVFGGAVAYGVLRDGVTRPELVACFGRADLEAPTEVPALVAAGPVEACAGLWRQGVFGPVTEVPPLAACVLPTGAAGVFPAMGGADVCTALNLVPISAPPPPLPLQPTTTPTSGQSTETTAGDLNSRIVAFRDATVGQFLSSPCVSPQAGADIVRRELDRAALRDWTVVTGDFSADRPCATVSVRSEERQVLLVPAPARR
jgi:hypothetical protein